jgi:hypothetical protein
MISLLDYQPIKHGKNTEIKFVRQPVFKQILSLLEVIEIKAIIKRNESDKYYSLQLSDTVGNNAYRHTEPL